ncbi:MAG: ABC transporter permease [Vampirovibrionales bacterium]
MAWIHWRRGVYPIFKKNLVGETRGWFLEMLATIAVPLSFYLAFGLGLRGNIAPVEGVPYMAFITPGLIALTIQLEAFRSGAWNLWLSIRHHKTIDEYRIKPIGIADILVGDVLSGFVLALIKGFLVGTTLWVLAPFDLTWLRLGAFLGVMLPGAILFTCAGAVAGMAFRRPDQIAQIQSIVITPLLYLGGLFFPISRFPQAVQAVLVWIPTTAIFEGGRQAFLNGACPTAMGVGLWLGAMGAFLATVWWCERQLRH